MVEAAAGSPRRRDSAVGASSAETSDNSPKNKMVRQFYVGPVHSKRADALHKLVAGRYQEPELGTTKIRVTLAEFQRINQER